MNVLDLFGAETATVTFAANETIFLEREEGGTMYVIAEGTVRLSLTGRTLEKIGKGGFFGEMSVVDQEPRSATATALTDCRLIPVKLDRFRELIAQNPDFALEIMRVMARRIRSMDSRI
jgi:CRP-like cAMP-binding protein